MGLKHCRRFCRASAYRTVASATAFLLALGPCLAQSPPDSQNLLNAQLKIHYVPATERKPIPFELDHGHIVVKAQMDGHDVWALVDNGTTATSLDTGYAKSFGLDVGAPIGQVRTPSGSLEIRPVSDVEIKIPGQFSFRRYPLFSEDLSFASKEIGRPISLVIGKDIFDNFLLMFSFGSRCIQILPRGALQGPPGTMQLALKNDLPQVDILINGRPAVVAVDLGYGGVINLNNAAWNRLGLDEQASFEAPTAKRSPAPVKSTIVGEMSVGPIKVYQVSVDNEPIIPADGDGTIGLAFFSAFNFAVDLKAHRIWLFPRPDSGSEPGNADGSQAVTNH